MPPNLKDAAAESLLARPPELRPPTPSPQDIEMQNEALQLIESDFDGPIRTRAQGRKRKAGNLAESCPNRQSPRLNPTANRDENLTPAEALPTRIQPTKATSATSKTAAPAKIAGAAGVQKAIQKAQEQARKEMEIRDSMWG